MKKHVVSLLAALFALQLAYAQQFTFFDVNTDWKDGKGYLPYTRGEANWTKPYDYVNGTMYLRYEVIDKPSSIECEMQMGIWQTPDINISQKYFEMIAKVRPKFTDEGVIYANLNSPGSWHKVGGYSLDWDRSFHHTEILLKVSGDKILRSTWCGSHCYTNSDINKHIPIRYHATTILVAKGHTFKPPEGWKNCPQDWGCGSAVDIKPQLRANRQYASPSKAMKYYTLTGRRINSGAVGSMPRLIIAQNGMKMHILPISASK
jgi:hypothetical protein